MLKVPFLEHTGLSLEIISNTVRWVEADRIGGRWSLSSWGELSHSASEASIMEALEEICSQLKSEAFHVSVTLPETLIEMVIEDVPFSEEPEETDRWIIQRKKELLEEYNTEQVEIQYYLVQVEEDNQRCLFQIVNKTEVSFLCSLLKKAGLYPEYVGTGLLEPGYSQLYNQEFIEGSSSVVQKVNDAFFLSIFEKGLLKNIYQLEVSGEAAKQQVLQEAHSYLLTEEASGDLTLNSVPLYMLSEKGGASSKQALQERVCNNLVPFFGKKGFEELPDRYSKCLGALVRLFFDGLDAFNFSDQENVIQGVQNHDKKETIRLGILLFAPLILFAFIAYGLHKMVDYQLVESNQVMEQIGNRIDEVNQRRIELLETQDRFLEARSILQEKEPVAHIFEQIARLIPAQMWLTELSLDNTRTNATQILASGYASAENAITDFLKELEAIEEVGQVSLILSEKPKGSFRSSVSQELAGMTRFELLIEFNKQ